MPRETREMTGLLAEIERRCLVWIAGRLPRWIAPDHLTALGLAAMAAAGASYALARDDPRWLWGAVAALAVNWFGDSLDGTVARVRRRERPRYGFYVDHVLDAVGILMLLTGIALSGLMSPGLACGVLVAYYLVSIEVYLATHALGTFRLAIFRVGPTELRIVLATGTLMALDHGRINFLGAERLLFDVGGAVAIVGLAAGFVRSAVSNAISLARAERPPVGVSG
jgi:phosphatidylglycerophosphate synthase